MRCRIGGYHEWLISLVDTPDEDFRYNYVKLMDFLDIVEYKWNNQKDENRAIDGINLRDEYSDIYGDYGFRDGMPCTVLECLVALFVRYSDTILVDAGSESVAPELFFDCMECFGLLQYDDMRFDWRGVDEILEPWISGKITIFNMPTGDLFLQVGKYAMSKNP